MVIPDYHRIEPLVSGKRQVKVLFICLGNICRSPAAQALLQEVIDSHHAQNQWLVDSAGIGSWHVGDLPDPRMRAHARQRDLHLTHRCRQITQSDFFDFDIIIGMDATNISDLHSLAPSVDTEAKILPMADFFSNFRHFDHVPDPYYDGAEGFERVLDLLTEATLNLYDTINHYR